MRCVYSTMIQCQEPHTSHLCRSVYGRCKCGSWGTVDMLSASHHPAPRAWGDAPAQLRTSSDVSCTQTMLKLYSTHKPCSNRILHTTMLKLYPAYKLCSNCILHTNHTQAVSCTQTTLRLYPEHKPHSNFNLHTNHIQTVSCKQTMLKLYLAYKPCSNCILQINHAQSQTVSCKQTTLKLYLAYKPCSNWFSLHFIKLFFFTKLSASPKYIKFFSLPQIMIISYHKQ